MEKNSPYDLFFELALRHLYNAEIQTKENLALLAASASSEELKDLFTHHRSETEEQIRRLEQICKTLSIHLDQSISEGIGGFVERSKEIIKNLAALNLTNRSKGMEGIISEGKEMLRHFANTEVNDLSLISSAKKVEHFEIGCYESLSLLAEHYNLGDGVNLLKTSLEEEKRTDERLSKLSENIYIPEKAAR